MKKGSHLSLLLHYNGKKYSFFILSIMLLLCAVSVGVSFWSIKQSESLHGDLVRTQIYELKKSFLQDSVENMITHIDAARSMQLQQETALAQTIVNNISFLLTQDENIPINNAVAALLQNSPFAWKIQNIDTDQILFSSSESLFAAEVNVISNNVNHYEVACAIPQEFIDNKVKQAIHDEIHAQKFHNSSYIWVNEIINWDGGVDYAVRLIHPNLKETEGLLLSTETEDIAGNKPYLEELEGVKEHGSLFSRYYFKRLENNEISEKLTYASLYKDFNWIVAMGIHVDDLEFFISEIKKTSDELNKKLYVIAAVCIIFFFLTCIILITIIGYQYLKQTRAEIRSEANRDPLTGALNRRIGIEVLRRQLDAVKKGKPSSLLFSLDIDNFKHVNDTYGHDTGDVVLKKLVKIIRKTMRESDFLFRWGGEEFLILYDADKSQLNFLAERLNNAVEQSVIEVIQIQKTIPSFVGFDNLNPQNTINSADSSFIRTSNEKTGITVSIGVSWFDSSDTTYQVAVKRADMGLYEAKRQGKNTYRVEKP